MEKDEGSSKPSSSKKKRNRDSFSGKVEVFNPVTDSESGEKRKKKREKKEVELHTVRVESEGAKDSGASKGKEKEASEMLKDEGSSKPSSSKKMINSMSFSSKVEVLNPVTDSESGEKRKKKREEKDGELSGEKRKKKREKKEGELQTVRVESEGAKDSGASKGKEKEASEMEKEGGSSKPSSSKKKRNSMSFSSEVEVLNPVTDSESGEKRKKKREKKDGELSGEKRKKRREKKEGKLHTARLESEGAKDSGASKGKEKEASEMLKDEGSSKPSSSKKKRNSVSFSSKVEVLNPVTDSESGEKRKKKREKKEGELHTVGLESEGAKDSGASKGKEKGASEMEKDEGSSKPSSSKKKRNRVSFSSKVEVFNPVTDSEHEEEEGTRLVQGKRFSKEEDSKILDAIERYIETNQLGEEGKEMILNVKKYPQVKNCWVEIGACLPERPYRAVYFRSHVLLERSEKRKWEPEEYDAIKRFHKEQGANWKVLADQLGKHRKHVKDTWRRIKLPNLKKGSWSQEEYQTLFDLVNLDLRLKAFEEKKSKHGMLRDNIAWEAISCKLSTRATHSCCLKWYDQLSSSLVKEGVWADTDDYHLLEALQNLDASCVEDVDWDNLLEDRSGEICRKRWNQMVRYIGGHKERPFVEQVEVLSNRYCPEMLEYRK